MTRPSHAHPASGNCAQRCSASTPAKKAMTATPILHRANNLGIMTIVPRTWLVVTVPKRIIKRYLPDHRKIREHKHLRFFGALLHVPNLWHLNRRSVSGAMSVGLVSACFPFPFHILLAVAMAIRLRVIILISVG